MIPKKPFGERTYEVRINSDVIATFKHRRGDGLSGCLFEASKAVEKKKWENVEEYLRAEDSLYYNQDTHRIKLP